MRTLVLSLVVVAFAPLASRTLGAQQSERVPLATPHVPASMMPPEGKCRIWIEDLAPAQQPAPTDCQTALRQRPPNGTVIFGRVTRERDSARFESPTARLVPPARRAPERRPATPTRDSTKSLPRDSAESSARPPVRPPARPRRPAEKRPERP